MSPKVLEMMTEFITEINDIDNKAHELSKFEYYSRMEPVLRRCIMLTEKYIPDIGAYVNFSDEKDFSDYAKIVRTRLELFLDEQTTANNQNLSLPVNNTKETQRDTETANAPMIFLSHKSDDKKYGDALRNFIIGLGVKNNQLIYSSHHLNKIPLGKNIYEYLRENIHNGIFMIILWSDQYLDSPACLNEMGAAWVTQADYTNIYTPNFSFGNPKYHQCAVDTRKMGAVLNGDKHCKASMIELKKQIQSMFGLEDDEQVSQDLLDQFMEAIA